MLKLFDFLQKSLIKSLEEKKVICLNCRKENTLKINPLKFTTFKCNCGIRIFYPPHKARDFGVTVFVSYVENKIDKLIKAENLKIKSEDDYLKVYEKVLETFGIDSEPKKLYSYYKKRVGFANARKYGRIKQKA